MLEVASVVDVVVVVVSSKDSAEVLHKTNRTVNQTVRTLSETLGRNLLSRLRPRKRARWVLVFCTLC